MTHHEFHFIDRKTVLRDMLDISLGIVRIIPNELHTIISIRCYIAMRCYSRGPPLATSPPAPPQTDPPPPPALLRATESRPSSRSARAGPFRRLGPSESS